MDSNRFYGRLIAPCLIGIAILGLSGSCFADQTGFDATPLTQTIERAFGEAWDAINVLFTQGPQAFIQVLKHFLLTLPNAIVNPNN